MVPFVWKNPSVQQISREPTHVRDVVTGPAGPVPIDLWSGPLGRLVVSGPGVPWVRIDRAETEAERAGRAKAEAKGRRPPGLAVGSPHDRDGRTVARLRRPYRSGERYQADVRWRDGADPLDVAMTHALAGTYRVGAHGFILNLFKAVYLLLKAVFFIFAFFAN
jgi:hypothetical protein